MMDFLASAYLWIKALHIVSVIAWMSGMLYLPRLFVYHRDCEPGSETAELLKVMERRLLRAIINPAMIGVFVFGIAMLFVPGLIDWSSGWIYVKLAAVAGLSILHHFLAHWRKAFEADRPIHSTRFFRIANEVVTVFMVIIVFMVVLKPF